MGASPTLCPETWLFEIKKDGGILLAMGRPNRGKGPGYYYLSCYCLDFISFFDESIFYNLITVKSLKKT